MLRLPEYLTFTTAAPAADRVPISVHFGDSVAKMPERYIDCDLLNQLILAVSQGDLRFMSFDEHPMRVIAIGYPKAGRRAVVTARSLTSDDGFPKRWEPVEHDNLSVDNFTQPPELSRPAVAPRLRVGTLSSELNGSEMRLEKNAASVSAIMDALEIHRPEVLLTAGYSLNDEADLAALEARLEASDWDGLLFVEVKHYGGDLPHLIAPGQELSSHCLFAWTRDGGWKRMGRQYFVTSVAARLHLTTLVAAFEKNLSRRIVEFRGRRFGALICGEINALQGRNTVKALTPEIESWLRNLDVIVNPTHDLMGNAGTLIAKRKWASQNGKVYLSASNWNSGKARRQTRNARTLHTVFIDGREAVLALDPRPNENYEYREVYI